MACMWNFQPSGTQGEHDRWGQNLTHVYKGTCTKASCLSQGGENRWLANGPGKRLRWHPLFRVTIQADDEQTKADGWHQLSRVHAGRQPDGVYWFREVQVEGQPATGDWFNLSPENSLMRSEISRSTGDWRESTMGWPGIQIALWHPTNKYMYLSLIRLSAIWTWGSNKVGWVEILIHQK